MPKKTKSSSKEPVKNLFWLVSGVLSYIKGEKNWEQYRKIRVLEVLEIVKNNTWLNPLQIEMQSIQVK
ncbi:MAG: hypothetical protein LH479_05695 [Polaromonas sp.]|nr:hypothetical protein [Polaromonas sp.]